LKEKKSKLFQKKSEMKRERKCIKKEPLRGEDCVGNETDSFSLQV